jgi:hypothetical protein
MTQVTDAGATHQAHMQRCVQAVRSHHIWGVPDALLSSTRAQQVVSQANITELHEPLALDGSAALGGAGAGAADGDSYRGRDFGVWSIAWSPQGGQIIAGGCCSL